MSGLEPGQIEIAPRSARRFRPILRAECIRGFGADPASIPTDKEPRNGRGDSFAERVTIRQESPRGGRERTKHGQRQPGTAAGV